MPLLLVFSISLLFAVLISERAERTILSTSVLFLLTGGHGLGPIGIIKAVERVSAEVVYSFRPLRPSRK